MNGTFGLTEKLYGLTILKSRTLFSLFSQTARKGKETKKEWIEYLAGLRNLKRRFCEFFDLNINPLNLLKAESVLTLIEILFLFR